MIPNLLERSDSGSWRIPNDSLIEQIELLLTKCDSAFQRILTNQNETENLTCLRGRLKLLTESLVPFRQVAIKEIYRTAFIHLFAGIATDIDRLKSQTALCTELQELRQAIGDVPPAFVSAPFDVADKRGRRPLHLAALHGQIQLVRFLADKGAKVDAADDEGVQAIHLAAAMGHLEVVKLLLEKGATVDASIYSRSQNLERAGNKLYLPPTIGPKIGLAKMRTSPARDLHSMWQRMLKRQEALKMGAYYLRQPLHFAAQKGHLEVVKLLLERGAPVDSADEWSSQPLHLAAQEGHLEVVKLLLERGATVDAADNEGRQPLHLAASIGRKATLPLLDDTRAPIDAAELAAVERQKAIIELLLENGATFYAADNDGRQPLHWAAFYGQTEIAEFLLSKGADLNAKDAIGRQPLSDATSQLQMGTIEFLLTRGANVPAPPEEELRRLYMAAQCVYGEVVAPLLAASDKGDSYRDQPIHLLAENRHRRDVEPPLAKSDQGDSYEDQPIHSAARNGDVEEIKLLIESGATVDAKNGIGDQPIHLAAENGHLEALEVLFANGANVNARNTMGDRPLHLAARQGHEKVVKLLIANGAEVNVRNKIGDQPLDIADQMRHEKVVELLSAQHSKSTAIS